MSETISYGPYKVIVEADRVVNTLAECEALDIIQKTMTRLVDEMNEMLPEGWIAREA